MLTIDNFYPSDIHIPGRTLLLNIETTGLSPRTAFVFMIGLGWAEDNGWHFRCLLAEKKMDERELMQTFHQMLQDFNQVLTYGGYSFTFRFLEERWKNYIDSDSVSEDADRLFQGIRRLDIQKALSPYRHLLPVTDIKKSSAEQFIHYKRREHLAPKELIKCYMAWEVSGEETLLTQLTDHHAADMAGLLSLHSLSAYALFFKGDFDCIQHYEYDEDHNCCRFHIALKMPVPVPVQATGKSLSFSLGNDSATLCLPLFHGELKYFLPGSVKDYYYLPEEDQAVHRSVACYVDKAYRQKATAATCYIRQSGTFLPAADESLQPCFKECYNADHFYILYDEEKFASEPDDLKRCLSALIKNFQK